MRVAVRRPENAWGRNIMSGFGKDSYRLFQRKILRNSPADLFLTLRDANVILDSQSGVTLSHSVAIWYWAG